MPTNDKPRTDARVVPPGAPRKTFRGPDFREVYANTSQGAFTPWDIEITFGRLGFFEGEPAVEELVAVIFSPHHAKAVAKVLAHAVESWEKQHGEIVLTEGQMPGTTGKPAPATAPKTLPKR